MINIKKFLLLILAVNLILTVNAYNPPIMGWSSWNTYRVNISDSLIRMQADALKVTGLFKAGYNHVHIDDGFFGGRDQQGKLLTHPVRFPDGLHHLVTYLHKSNFKAGIYSDAGINTCGSIYDKDSMGLGVGLYGHEKQDIERYFNDWNFDFIKIDYCGGKRQKLNEESRYTEIVEALKRYSNKKVQLNICRWAFPGTWVCRLADSWRTTSDIQPSWNSIKRIIAKNLYLSPYASNGHFNDMDMLEIGRGLSEQEEITHFGMWCMMSSPLLIGCDITKIPTFSLQLLLNKELIAINQDSLALQAHVAYRSNGCYVLVKDIKRNHGRQRAVALYNPTNESQKCLFDPSKLEYKGESVLVKNLINNEGWVKKTKTFVEIPPHATILYRLKGNRTDFPTRYEAEEAWLEKYQDIWNDKELVHCAKMNYASGGIVVKYVGRSADNFMEWKRIFVPRKGTYKLTIHYFSPEKRSLSIAVNGKDVHTRQVLPSQKNQSNKISVNLSLKKNYNSLRLFNEKEWAPFIDFIEIEEK